MQVVDHSSLGAVSGLDLVRVWLVTAALIEDGTDHSWTEDGFAVSGTLIGKPRSNFLTF